MAVLAIVVGLLAWSSKAANALPVDDPSTDPALQKAYDLLDRVPLIDGHNDFPHAVRVLIDNQLDRVNLTDVSNVPAFVNYEENHTDMRRLRLGHIGAQFWVAFTHCHHPDVTVRILEQIDVIHRLIDAYPETLRLATNAKEIEEVMAAGRIASLIGVEGGHPMSNSLAILRTFYRLGVRYMTLTHTCPTSWADNSQLDEPGKQAINGGLNSFGKSVVYEMNRLGMMVDLSHVSEATMEAALNVSLAPVIFSHSGARAVCDHTRNVPDGVLRRLPANGGLVMVVFYPGFVSCRLNGTLGDVVDHIDHIRDVAGVDHVGIGSDFSGIDRVPTGLEDVSKYPHLVAEMLRRGWTEVDVEKVINTNLLRVLRRVEQVRDEMATAGVKPQERRL